MPTIANDRKIVLGNFILDLANECLWQGSKSIKIRPKAFAVLHYLVARPGQLVTKDELLSAVWPETFVGDAVLKVTIRQLREVLMDDPKAPRFIETAHRRGYRFIGHLNERETQTPVAPFPLVRERPQVIGRGPALSRMQDLLEKTLAGERQICFITGEAGIGKTCLVDAFADSIAANTDVRIARGQCLEQFGTAEAYLPVLEAIGRLCRDEPQVAQLIRTHAPMWLQQMPSLVEPDDRELLLREISGSSRERMLREIGEALSALTSECPLLLILEDLHWSDYSTLDLISYLATQRTPAKLMLIGTYRSVELIVNRHPLKAVKQELLAKHQCEELPVDYLNVENISDYLCSKFPCNRFPKGLSELIHERTEGNPLFMVNAVNFLAETKVIVEREGCWEFTADIGDVEIGVPDNVRQMIDKQLDFLDVQDRSTLEAASVTGTEFSTFSLCAALGAEIDAVEERCEQLAQGQYIQDRGIQELPNGEVATRYGFVHALYQNVLYQRLSASHRVQLHRRIGEKLEEIYGERAREIAAELAMHFERSRDYSAAAKYLQKAADTAIRCFAYREAVALARHGLELLAKLPETAERTNRELCLQLTLGVPLIAREGYASPNVGRVYLRARELLQVVGDTPDASEVLWGVWTFYTLSAELRTAREIGEQFLQLSQRVSHPGFLMRSHLVMQVTLLHQGEFDKALEHYVTAASLYEPKRHLDDAFYYAQNPGVALPCFAAWTLWFLGKADQSLEHMQEALKTARQLNEPHGLAHAFLFAAILHQLRREYRKALEYAEGVLLVSHDHGLVMYEAQAKNVRAWALAQENSPAATIDDLKHGIANYRATGTALLLPQFNGLLAELLGRDGKHGEGLTEVSKAIDAAERTGDASYLAELYRIKGELLLGSTYSNLHGEAEACFAKSIDLAQKQNASAWELRSSMSMAQLYRSQKKTQKARKVLEPVYNRFTEGFGTWDLREAKALLEIL